MLTPERKRIMMVVTCLLSFLFAMSTEKVMMLVRKPRIDRMTHTQPAALWVSELIMGLSLIVRGRARSVYCQYVITLKLSDRNRS